MSTLRDADREDEDRRPRHLVLPRLPALSALTGSRLKALARDADPEAIRLCLGGCLIQGGKADAGASF